MGLVFRRIDNEKLIMRLPRKEKKKIRHILLCHTNNFECKKLKISKKVWLDLKSQYTLWIEDFNMQDIKLANQVKPKN